MEEDDLRALFIEESREYLRRLGKEIACLEENCPAPDELKNILRYAHSLKGMAATMGVEEVCSVASLLETAFKKVRDGELAIGPGEYEILRRAMGVIGALIDGYERGTAPPAGRAKIEESLSRIVN